MLHVTNSAQRIHMPGSCQSISDEGQLRLLGKKGLAPPLFFKEEPPGWVPFLNSTGAVVPCSAGGSPPPTVTWRKADSGAPVTELPGLRQLRPDGSLVFPPFGVDQYRPDVHATSYRCEASNSFGIIGSRDVRVTAGTWHAA
ncbi:hypothetical protein MTO96_013634 [Rhipicephalus appendiculatus]